MASGVAATFGVAFFVFGLEDLVEEPSFVDFGVDVPFVAFGVFNLMLSFTFLLESLGCDISTLISVAG
jgi:hypothetical protein